MVSTTGTIRPIRQPRLTVIMGKKLTFIGFLLALLCLLPYGIYQFFNDEDSLSLTLGMITLIGFPLFSLLSFVGMMLWLVAELRKPSGRKDNHPK